MALGLQVPRRLADIGLAGFLIAMTVVSLWGASLGDWVESVDVIAYCAATCLLVISSLRRSEAAESDHRWWVWLVCLVSTLSFLCYQGSAPLLLLLVVVHLIGDLGLVYLGASFSIMPSRREIKSGLWYRVVRHPVYASYAIADIVFLSQVPSLWNFAVCVVAITLYLVRANLEEEVLGRDTRYREYCQRTPFRFLPWIY